ncbi:MAG TPA: hypothetical protein VJH68_02855 [Candidatus Nanoarchaeia archaeon]|nr:hypothetical protein [Candidatus Nanoarchaeia archaeon]
MDLIQEAFHRLFPEQKWAYQTKLEYNRRLSDFNANINFNQSTIKVSLNLQWKDIDPEIKIGLVQQLLLKIFKKNRISTPNIDLYHCFVRNIPLLTEKTQFNPQLEDSFNRVNQQLLDSSLEKTNLCWGQQSFRKLAHYNFHQDSITISSIFQDAPLPLLDYIMYHEMLHKYHKFHQHNGRSSYHSKQFKQDEAKYPDSKNVEQQIQQLVRNKQQKLRKGLWRFF